MLNLTWIKNPDHVSYCKENEVLPRLARELGIAPGTAGRGIPDPPHGGGGKI